MKCTDCKTPEQILCDIEDEQTFIDLQCECSKKIKPIIDEMLAEIADAYVARSIRLGGTVDAVGMNKKTRAYKQRLEEALQTEGGFW